MPSDNDGLDEECPIEGLCVLMLHAWIRAVSEYVLSQRMQSQSFFIRQMTIERGPSLGEINGKVIFLQTAVSKFYMLFRRRHNCLPDPAPVPRF